MEVYVGACGCICSDCRAFGTDCGGCFAIAGKPVWLPEVNLEVCDFYECSVLDRGFKHCGECSEIPATSSGRTRIQPGLRSSTDRSWKSGLNCS